MTKELALNNGQVSLVDDDDFEWLSSFTWYVAMNRKTPYVQRSINGKLSNTTKQMHREIMTRHGLVDDGYVVDHINRNTLDNRKANLRQCTHAQNSRNSKDEPRACDYKGVTIIRCPRIMYQASIVLNKKRIYGGLYADQCIAGQVYNVLAAHYHEEFAVLNIIPEGQLLTPSELLKHVKPRLKAVRDLIEHSHVLADEYTERAQLVLVYDRKRGGWFSEDAPPEWVTNGYQLKKTIKRLEAA